MITRITLCIILAVAGTSCATLHMKGTCVSGPNKGARITAQADYNGLSTSGPITAIAPWGEKIEGRYITSPYSGSTKEWEEEERRSGNNTSSWGSDVIIESDGTTQVGTATLLGDRGTVFDVIYWASIHSPTHGQGKMKDTRGNRYKLVW